MIYISVADSMVYVRLKFRPNCAIQIYYYYYCCCYYYRAMHYSAKRGLAIARRLSVHLSVCDVGGSGSHRLEILETNCTDN